MRMRTLSTNFSSSSECINRSVKPLTVLYDEPKKSGLASSVYHELAGSSALKMQPVPK